MPMRRLRQLRSENEGFALIEVLISALIVVLITAAVVQTLVATGRASTEERHRSQAFSVAQEDQARLRGMQISTLQQGLEPRTVTVGGTPFTVTSTATYVSAKTGATQCGGGGKADYVRIGSSVTWPTMHEGAAPIKIESILSPTSGSVDATSGGIAIALLNSNEKGTAEEKALRGIPLTGSGPATFFGSTNSEGCALFGGEPAGSYTVTPSLPGSGWVNEKGEPAGAFPAEISGGITIYKEVHYDHAAKLEAEFTVRPRGAVKKPAVATTGDSILVFNPKVPAKPFFSPGLEFRSVVEAPSLYPFETGYSVWGGSCLPANTALEPEGLAKSTVLVTPGGTAKFPVQLPALYLTVKNTAVAAEKTYSSGAVVTLKDLNCTKPGGEPLVRKYTTTAIGSLGAYNTKSEIPKFETPGVPTGEYEICASKGGRKFVIEKLIVKSLEGVSPTINLNETGWKPGEC